MKTLILSLLLGILMFAQSTPSQSQDIYANVSGDTVTLLQTLVWRNCGSMFRADVYQNNYILDWYQVDTGATATCYCVFDLSVTYGPLEPGAYTANVFSIAAWDPTDTVYEGSVEFVIAQPKGGHSGGGVISSWQSDCYSGQGIEEGKGIETFRIYPVPVRDRQVVHFETDINAEEAILEIFTITGQLVFRKDYTDNLKIGDQWPGESLFPVAGMYVVRLRTVQGVRTQLIPVQ